MVAPQDGTFITVASQALLIFEATGQRGLQTSIGNFKWLGSFTQSNNVTVTWHTSKVKTLQTRSRARSRWGRPAPPAARWSDRRSTTPSSARNSRCPGLPGRRPCQLAMKRGEVDGRGNNTWAGYKATMTNEVRDGNAQRADPDRPTQGTGPAARAAVPDLVNGDPERNRSRHSCQSGRDRAAICSAAGRSGRARRMLRRAFDATMKDRSSWLRRRR